MIAAASRLGQASRRWPARAPVVADRPDDDVVVAYGPCRLGGRPSLLHPAHSGVRAGAHLDLVLLAKDIRVTLPLAEVTSRRARVARSRGCSTFVEQPVRLQRLPCRWTQTDAGIGSGRRMLLGVPGSWWAWSPPPTPRAGPRDGRHEMPVPPCHSAATRPLTARSTSVTTACSHSSATPTHSPSCRQRSWAEVCQQLRHLGGRSARWSPGLRR